MIKYTDKDKIRKAIVKSVQEQTGVDLELKDPDVLQDACLHLIKVVEEAERLMEEKGPEEMTYYLLDTIMELTISSHLFKKAFKRERGEV